MPGRFTIDPDDVDSYGLNLIHWLEGDSAVSCTIQDVTPGLSVVAPQVQSPRVFATVSGGTPPNRYHATYRVGTLGGRVRDFTLTFDSRKR